MIIPPLTALLWRELVTGRVKYAFAYLMAKVFQGALARTLQKAPSPASLLRHGNILRELELFVPNAAQLLARQDLLKITGKEVTGGT